MSFAGEPELKQLLAHSAGYFNTFLHADVLPRIRAGVAPQLAEPMIYSLDAPGKRIRPVLCLWSAGIGFSEQDPAAPRARSACFAGAAIEAIHTYSLIHDDLPAMDDDDLRRGRPACHRQFSEWAAILAGDALNTYAFELLAFAAETLGRPAALAEFVPVLAEGAGRMVCGQALDLDFERGSASTLKRGSASTLKRGSASDPAGTRDESPAAREQVRARLDEIHRKKTAALIRASLELGAIVAGVYAAGRARFGEFGTDLGLLFQIADDLLDVQGDTASLGKTAGKDAASGKLTYPALYGLEESRRKAHDLQARLETLATELPVATPELTRAFQMLPAFVAGRRS